MYGLKWLDEFPRLRYVTSDEEDGQSILYAIILYGGHYHTDAVEAERRSSSNYSCSYQAHRKNLCCNGGGFVHVCSCDNEVELLITLNWNYHSKIK